jgi:predicted Ser/Thr protein kinase
MSAEPGSSAERAHIDAALAQVRALRTEAAPLPAISGYELERELHCGGQGVVFRARQCSTGRTVALKLLRDELVSSGARQRFEREVAVLAALEHPALVRILDCGLHEGRCFYVMEYVDGADLDAELHERPRVLRERVALLARVAHAVAAAHQRGVLHRDLKPSNIRIDAHGEPRLVDFGLARWLRADAPGESVRTLTEAGAFVGSAPWASPEQVAGEPIDARSDVYSLGVVAYQALTGRFPYEVTGPLARVFEAIRTTRPLDARRAASEVDRDLATILARALEKDPEQRYAGALDFARDLEHWLAGRPIEARRASWLYVAWKAVRRRPLTSAAACAAVVALLAALVSLARQRGELRAVVTELGVRLHVEELRRLGEALESGDGARLAGALSEVPAERRDWLVEHFEQRLAERAVVFAAPGERPLALTFAPDGETLALGTWQGTVRLLARNDGRERWSNTVDLAEVRALEFTPDGTAVLTLESRALVFLRAADGALLRRLDWPEGGLERLSLGGGRVLLASQAGVVLRTTLEAGEPWQVLRLRHAVSAAADDVRGTSGIDLTAVHATAMRAATVGDGELVLWETESGTELARVALHAFSDRAARGPVFSEDGARLAVAFPPLETRAAGLWVFDSASGRRLHTLDALETTPDPFALREETAWVGGPGGAVGELDLVSGLTRRIWPGFAALDGVRLGPDGDELYLLARRLERVPLEEAPRTLRLAAGDPLSVREDNRSARADGARVRAFEDEKPLFETTLPERETITALCWLAGEDLLAAGTERGSLWFLGVRGAVLANWDGLGAPLIELTFDADSSSLAGRDGNGRELVWRSRPRGARAGE